ncbi:hypothetical protein KCV03_g8464, partial [Aureobasidium melanogenum]
MSTLALSISDKPSVTPPLRRLAPHRRYAMKFLSLPDELLTNISDNVAPGDLPNFRLACKTLANIATKHFGAKRLAHRRFILTEYSLKGLVDMTAHPVFGPCVKSIMFGTDRTTNQLEVLMDALESRKVTDHTEKVRVLQLYRERWDQRSAFLRSSAFGMLVDAIRNISSYGTSVSLGIFNDVRNEYRNERFMPGYGSFREYEGLPFLKVLSLHASMFRAIRMACRIANFRPQLLELDLNGQEVDSGMEPTLSRLLLNEGRLQSNLDACIRQGSVDIRVLTSLNLVEFKQRSMIDERLSAAEDCYLDLRWLGQPMVNALFALPLTHFRMESCSMRPSGIVKVLKAFAETLQVVEIIDVAIFGLTGFEPTIDLVLRCLKDDLHIRTLVLDGIRLWEDDHTERPGMTVAKGRFWNGQQQIGAGLDVLLGFDGFGWDGDYEGGWRKEAMRNEELRIQSITYSQHEHSMDYTRYLQYKVLQDRYLENWERDFAERKATRERAKEAMVRVEAREFSA